MLTLTNRAYQLARLLCPRVVAAVRQRPSVSLVQICRLLVRGAGGVVCATAPQSGGARSRFGPFHSGVAELSGPQLLEAFESGDRAIPCQARTPTRLLGRPR